MPPRKAAAEPDPLSDFNKMDISSTNRAIMRYNVPDLGEFVIHNILASAQLVGEKGRQLHIDLEEAADIFTNAYFEKSEFAALRLRLDYGGVRYAVSIFDTGRIQSTGGVDIDQTHYLLLKVGKHIAKKLGSIRYSSVSLQRFDVQNILAVLDLQTCISLRSLAASVPGGVDYEPDKFPSARFKIPVDQDVTVEEYEGVLAAAERKQTEDDKPKKKVIDLRSKAAKAKETSRLQKYEKQEHVTVNVFSTGKVTFTGARSIRSIIYAYGTIVKYINDVLPANRKTTGSAQRDKATPQIERHSHPYK